MGFEHHHIGSRTHTHAFSVWRIFRSNYRYSHVYSSKESLLQQKKPIFPLVKLSKVDRERTGGWVFFLNSIMERKTAQLGVASGISLAAPSRALGGLYWKVSKAGSIVQQIPKMHRLYFKRARKGFFPLTSYFLLNYLHM